MFREMVVRVLVGENEGYIVVGYLPGACGRWRMRSYHCGQRELDRHVGELVVRILADPRRAELASVRQQSRTPPSRPRHVRNGWCDGALPRWPSGVTSSGNR